MAARKKIEAAQQECGARAATSVLREFKTSSGALFTPEDLSLACLSGVYCGIYHLLCLILIILPAAA